ncbi:hypothetical protein BC828DRAFT_397791 [Blastocladiella britannica]|nr:hypothetical protein BC828DRAFT_397791 [Blastocladiella britannica]
MDLPLSDKRFTGKTIPRWNISKNAGVEYVQGSFSIILKKGEQQSENRTSSIITPKSKDQKALKIELYESDVESPLFVTDAGCRKLGVITLSADARTTTIELLVRPPIFY